MYSVVKKMKKIVIGSLRKSAGKTSIILGLSVASKKKISYLKPFGDRLVYRKKQLWDYDSLLLANVLKLSEEPQDMTLGFEHSKLRFMYSEADLKKELLKRVADFGTDKDIIFIECGEDLTYGKSLNLDAISLTKSIDGKLILVINGDPNKIIDEIQFIKDYIVSEKATQKIDFGGVIINKVEDLEDFNGTYLSMIEEIGVKILGVVPKLEELTRISLHYLADNLFAKVIVGEEKLDNLVQSIFIGAMSANQAIKDPRFRKKNRLIITSGDRSDIIIGALENYTAGIILTNNIMPPPNIISKVEDHNIPMLLVPSDTYQIAKQIEGMEPLLTKNDNVRTKLLVELVKKYIKINEVI